jgi:NAD(P)-dependent dehydrogenase (short-subunit alcohol dehydrogenase family)
MTKCVLVTGAGSFIGQHLVKREYKLLGSSCDNQEISEDLSAELEGEQP